MKKISLVQNNFDGNELKYVTRAIKTGWVSSQGPYIKNFENRFKKFIGTSYALAVSNGTVALQLALASLGIKKNDEIIVPNLTFASPVNAILHSGARPILCDIDPKSYCVNYELLKKKITKRTKAIIIVHLYGYPVDLTRILELKKKNIFIIEDCAESLGSYIKNKHVGTFGDIGTFSFFANKTITTGEGGMLTFKNSLIYKKAKLLRDHGMSAKRKYWHLEVGFNFRITNLQAALGLAQLEKIKSFLKKKYFIGDVYKKYLCLNNNIQLPINNKVVINSFWNYPIRLINKLKYKRNQLISILNKNKIESRKAFYPINKMPAYHFLKEKNLKNSNKIYKEILCLPSGIHINHDDVRKICKIINKFS
jgi:perosamine synthetase